MTTYADVADSSIVREKSPLLWQGCRIFSRPQIRSAATLEVMVEDFCGGPFKTVLKEDELVAELNIPDPAEPYGWSYQRTTKRTAEDEALVVVAVLLCTGYVKVVKAILEVVKEGHSQ